MADKKISQLTAATLPLAGTEVLPIVQSGSTVKVANNDLRPLQIQSNATSGVLQIAGPAAASTRVMTTPDANFTAARTDAAQTFTGVQSFAAVVGNSATQTGVVSSKGNSTGNNLAYYAEQSNNASINYASNAFNASAKHMDFRWYGTSYGSISDVGGSQVAVNANNGLLLRTNGSNILSLGATDATLNAGNLVIGTSGKGIDFSATAQTAGMTSELLADYEEGTFTPLVKFATSAPSGFGSYFYRVGRYIKVGNVVHIWASVQLNGATAQSGAASMDLPFTSTNVTNLITPTSFGGFVFTGVTGIIIGYIAANSSSLSLKIFNNGDAQTDVDGANFQQYTGFYVYASYSVV